MYYYDINRRVNKNFKKSFMIIFSNFVVDFAPDFIMAYDGYNIAHLYYKYIYIYNASSSIRQPYMP